jgi:hypothetical protein
MARGEEEKKAEEKARSFISPQGLAMPDARSFEYLDALIKTNPYKAFTYVHATLQYQMRYTLYYFNAPNIRSQDFPIRWRLIPEHFSFRQLIEVCFIVGIIDGALRAKLIVFNHDRNAMIGHIDPELTKDFPDGEVAEICRRGSELIRQMDEIFRSILFSLPTKNGSIITK